MAFVNKSALATGSTTVLPVYAAATANNLLVATVTSHCTTASTLSGSTAGWTARQRAIVGVSEICEIWEKIAVGSDVMPTWNFAGGSQSSVDVSEFSGTTTFDKSGSATSTAASPLTVTASGIDGGTGRLIVAAIAIRFSGAQTAAGQTDNVNGLGVGTGINVISDDTATSQASHHRSIYVTTAVTGSVADNAVMTWPITSNREALCIVSYKTSAGLSLNIGGGSIAQLQVGVLAQGTFVFANLPIASTAGTCLVQLFSNIVGATVTAGPAGWVLAKAVSQASLARIEVWIYPNNPGGILTQGGWTESSAGTAAWFMETSEWSNVSALGTIDASGTLTSTSGTTLIPVTSGNVTTTGDLAISVWTQDTASLSVTFTSPANWTNLITDGVGARTNHIDAEYFINPGTGATLGPTLTSNQTTVSGAGVIVCLKPANALIDQTAKLEYGSMTMKLNTLDLSLLDPTTVPSLGDAVALNTPTWSGLVASVRSADIIDRATGHKRVTVSATNQSVLGSGAAPWNLSDNPNGSTTFGYAGLSVTNTQNSDGSTTVAGTCTVYQTGLLPGMTITVTSANLGLAAVSYQIINITETWTGHLNTPLYQVDFGSTILTMAGAAGGVLVKGSGSSTASIQPALAMPGGTLAYSQIVVTQTAITAITDIVGLTGTVAVGAGRRIRLRAFGLVSSTLTTGQFQLSITEAASQIAIGTVDFPIAALNVSVMVELILKPTAGSHTYQVRGAATTGTSTMVASGTAPAFFSIEDIGS